MAIELAIVCILLGIIIGLCAYRFVEMCAEELARRGAQRDRDADYDRGWADAARLPKWPVRPVLKGER